MGCKESFWKKLFKQWEAHLPRCWVTSPWEYTDKAGIKIGYSGKQMLKQPYSNNRCIMEEAMRIYTDKYTIVGINRIRSHLKVLWISDISSDDGRRVEQCYTEGTANPTRRFSYTWRCEASTRQDRVR